MALISRAALAAGLALVCACSTTQSLRLRENSAAAFAPWTDVAPVYRLGAGDRVRADFPLVPELSEEATVAPDGDLTLRAAGRLPAQGLTLPELEQAVERAAERRLRRPMVTLSLIQAPSARIVVGGAVARPGVYPLPASPTVLETVMLAGGFSPESRMDQVAVLRPGPNGTMLRTVDLRRFAARGDPAENIALSSGDIVFVPRSRIAELNLWVDQNINRLLPFSRSVSLTNSWEAAQ
jgi:polysaccharide biosynthesis/export protein PslD